MLKIIQKQNKNANNVNLCVFLKNSNAYKIVEWSPNIDWRTNKLHRVRSGVTCHTSWTPGIFRNASMNCVKNMSNQSSEVTDCQTTQNEKRENHLQGKFRKNWYNILYSYLHTLDGIMQNIITCQDCMRLINFPKHRYTFLRWYSSNKVRETVWL